MQKLLTFFSTNISVYAIFNDQSFKDTLTNDIVNFEQLGPGVCSGDIHALYNNRSGKRVWIHFQGRKYGKIVLSSFEKGSSI